MEQITFDLEVSKAGRDLGAGLALKNAGPSWNDRAEALVMEFYRGIGRGALFEEARDYAVKREIPPPPSPNAWGAICLSLSKREMIVKTGELMNSKSIRSHGRMSPLWRCNK